MKSTGSNSALTVEVTEGEGGMVVTLRGRLDAASLAGAWQKTVGEAEGKKAKAITIDGAGLDYCDGAGLGLFAELRRVAAENGGEVKFRGLNPELQRLVDMSLLADAKAGTLVPVKPWGIIVFTGMRAYEIWKDQYELVGFVGRLTAALCWAVAHPHKIRKRELLNIMEKTGVDALPVVSLLGLLIGVILAFQMAAPLERYGAQALIPLIVSFALIRELGPLVTAIIVAGRSGSAFAAELGTMKVTEELSALQTMGLEPAQFLVVPRVVATVLMAPLLTLYGIMLGLIGAGVVMVSLGYTVVFYINSVKDAIVLGDFLGGVFKSVVFALIVAGVGCLRGMQTKSGPGAVGDSTTRAVVSGIVLVIVADALIGVVFFYMGI